MLTLYWYSHSKYTSLGRPHVENGKKSVSNDSATQDDMNDRDFLKNNSMVDSRKSYVLSVSYYDQHTNGLYRLLSLQCWASTVNLTVVEPFIPETVLGLGKVPKYQNKWPLHFSDIYDINHWRSKVLQIPDSHHSALVDWEEFLETAHRNLVVADINYDGKECTFERFNAWPEFFHNYGFSIRNICIHLDPMNPISQKEFNSLVFPESNKEQSVVLFNVWKGILHKTERYHYVGLDDSKCTVGSGYNWVAKPSPAVYANATSYINKFLNGSQYVTLMLRTEFLVKTNLDNCLKRTLNAWKAVIGKSNSTFTFLTSDTGSYGSIAKISTSIRENFLDSVLTKVSGTIQQSIEERQKFLVEAAGTSNLSFLALVEKVIATKARCIVLVGGGHFQRHALKMYQKQHPEQEWCYIKFDPCRLKKAVPSSLKSWF